METCVKQYSINGIDVIAADGELTVINLSDFKVAVSLLAGKSGNLAIDLRNAKYIDSAAIEQLLIAFRKQSQQSNLLTIIVRQDSQPADVLHLLMIDTLATITSNASELGLVA